ncbi:MAG TPA: GspMb/PilO family protein [Aridibacter sp.]|nr:GspMb/PilO family protein [Aridibacter sp.]
MEDKQPIEESAPLEQEERTVVVEETVEELPARRRKQTVYKGMWGSLEMAAVGISLLFLLSVIAGYLLFVLPESRELEANRARRDQLVTELAAANRKFGNMTTTEGQVAKLVASAEDFEVRFLQEETIGKTAIYQRLNGLINAFGLVNSTGPDYTQIEISDEERRAGANERAQSGRAKYQSLFPGIYVTMTVEGSYMNLRRFLNEIENSNEYIVISSIELEPSETEESTTTEETQATTASTNSAAQGARDDTRGRTRGKVVSLRLELAAYFQRVNEMKILTAAPVAESAAAAN